MSETLFVEMDKHLEVLDEWRESRETTEELKHSFTTAGRQIKIALSEMKKRKNDPDAVEQCVTLLDMLDEVFSLNNNDIKKN